MKLIPKHQNKNSEQKLPTAATYNQWFKGVVSFITGKKDKDLIESNYKPTNSFDDSAKYYTRDGLDYDVVKNILGGKDADKKTLLGDRLFYNDFNDVYNTLQNKPYRPGREERVTDNSHLGRYTIGIGEDDNGRYISYYDLYDWAPKGMKEIFHPYEIYNRIYENDFNKIQEEISKIQYSGLNPSGKKFFYR